MSEIPVKKLVIIPKKLTKAHPRKSFSGFYVENKRRINWSKWSRIGYFKVLNRNFQRFEMYFK